MLLELLGHFIELMLGHFRVGGLFHFDGLVRIESLPLQPGAVHLGPTIFHPYP